ncbi:hypothetical protein MRB53_036579 [Persea americana]|nr:hypothetical protein MRB53_036763 [Persea americana]KAJ8614381.1 hypothetical protein MRB53_036579 [Persea americana]
MAGKLFDPRILEPAGTNGFGIQLFPPKSVPLLGVPFMVEPLRIVLPNLVEFVSHPDGYICQQEERNLKLIYSIVARSRLRKLSLKKPATAAFSSIFSSIQKPIQPPKAPHIQPVMWNAPPQGWIKLNIDGAAKGNPADRDSYRAGNRVSKSDLHPTVTERLYQLWLLSLVVPKLFRSNCQRNRLLFNQNTLERAVDLAFKPHKKSAKSLTKVSPEVVTSRTKLTKRCFINKERLGDLFRRSTFFLSMSLSLLAETALTGRSTPTTITVRTTRLDPFCTNGGFVRSDSPTPLDSKPTNHSSRVG